MKRGAHRSVCLRWRCATKSSRATRATTVQGMKTAAHTGKPPVLYTCGKQRSSVTN